MMVIGLVGQDWAEHTAAAPTRHSGASALSNRFNFGVEFTVVSSSG
jgi:hypothetical protein